MHHFCYRQTEGDAHVRLTMILFLVQLAEKSKRDSQLGWVTQIFLPHLIQLLLKKVQKPYKLGCVLWFHSRVRKRLQADQSVLSTVYHTASERDYGKPL